MEFSPLFLYLLLIATLIGLFLALFLIREPRSSGARALMALILGASLWSGGYALEFLSHGLDAKLFWAKFQYFGIATVPLAWFIFAVQHFESPGWTDRLHKYRFLLGIIPGLTIILVWTNDVHHLIWSEWQLYTEGPFQILQVVHGPWFWIYLGFGYLLMFFGSTRLVGNLVGSVQLHRWQIRLALFASLIPWFGNFIYVTHFNPIADVDWTPFLFSLAGCLFVVSLYRFHLVKIQPIAQRTIYAGLADGVLVLDAQDYIVDLNPAARRLIGASGGNALGKKISQVLPELDRWLEQAGYTEGFHAEIARGEGAEQYFYDLRVTALRGLSPRPIGRLVELHEITRHKHEQARLEQDRAHLEEVVAERTKALKLTIERLEHELTQRMLAEKRVEQVVESAPDAIFLIDRTGTIRLINAQAERLFGYTREELVGQSIERLLPLERRSEYRQELLDFLAQPEFRPSFPFEIDPQRKDGSEFPVEISLGPLKTIEGLWTACTIRDVSERKKAEQEQGRLLEELQQSHAELRALSLRLQDVEEFERRQIATELHDRVGQNLTGLNLNLEIIQHQLDPEVKIALRERLEDSQRLVEETTRQVRDVMADLHPPVLDEFGLVSALRWYAGNFSRRTRIAARLVGNEFEPRLPPNVEMALFRFVQEALNNVVKHAQATQVVISLESSEETACLSVQDNGCGFDPQAINEPNGQPHWGLITMQQRAAFIGGQLTVDSAPGQGTQISVAIRRCEP